MREVLLLLIERSPVKDILIPKNKNKNIWSESERINGTVHVKTNVD